MKMIIFLKDHVGLLSSHERKEEEIRQGCRLGLWVFKTEKGLAKGHLLLINNTVKCS